MSALTRGREPGSGACGCLLRPQSQAAWCSSHPRSCTHHLSPSDGVAASQMLTRNSPRHTLPPELCLGDYLEEYMHGTHARACSKVNSADDSMPVFNPMPWSDLVYQRNFTGKMVARGRTGAGKPNLNSLCVVIQMWDTCLHD